MNAIFLTVSLLSACVLCAYDPEAFLPAALGGVSSCLKTSATLFCIYAFWLGLSAVAEDCRITNGAAKALSPLCRRLFKTNNEEGVKNLSMNICCNVLGIGGAATPYAVKAVNLFEKDKNAFAQNLLFIINATSLQLIPTTAISLRAAAGSAAAYDITLPCLLSSAICTALSVTIYIVIDKIRNRKKCAFISPR